MSITLASNLAALKAQTQLGKATDQLSSVFERLSSGLRINKASDDAAGLAMSASLRADAKIYEQGVRNLNDGISLFNIVDESLSELTNIVERLEELANQAANGTYTDSQREALDAEAQALAEEFSRIAESTEFNDMDLLNGDTQSISLQAGMGSYATLFSEIGGAIGNGEFDGASTLGGVTFFENDVELADLDGDGNLDMISGGSVAAFIRMGTGTGSFGAITTVDIGGVEAGAIVLEDLNNDGNLDLVTTGASTNGITTVSLGNGEGTFSGTTSFIGDLGGSHDVTLGDINGDGVLDLVTAGRSTSGNYGTATVRLGLGDGQFGDATIFNSEYGTGGLAASSYGVALGDLNGDGFLDLVTAGTRDVVYGGAATVRFGDGTGSFGSETFIATESTTSNEVLLEDLNGDNILDLITVGSSSGDGYATVRLGVGNGTFGAATSYANETDTSKDFVLQDVNGDGNLDLITAGSSGSVGEATVRFGDGNGAFGSAASYETEGSSSGGVALGDVDGDGVVDLVTVGYDGLNSEATVRTGSTINGVAPILEFSLASLADAKQALGIFENKRDMLLVQRGEIGAFQSRLGFANNVLSVTRENLVAAVGRIQDADIASDVAEMVRLQILQQSTTALLAQANLQPGIALSLLEGLS